MDLLFHWVNLTLCVKIYIQKTHFTPLKNYMKLPNCLFLAKHGIIIQASSSTTRFLADETMPPHPHLKKGVEQKKGDPARLIARQHQLTMKEGAWMKKRCYQIASSIKPGTGSINDLREIQFTSPTAKGNLTFQRDQNGYSIKIRALLHAKAMCEKW